MILQQNILLSILERSRVDRSKKNILSICPWCGKDEFGVSLSNNHVFNCYRKSKCGETGNIFKLLKKLNRLDLLDNNHKQVTSLTKTKLENIINSKNIDSIDLSIPDIDLPIGWKRVYKNEYLDNRGYVFYDKYKVGISNLDRDLINYLIFPVEEEGKVKAYIARYSLNIPKDSKIKRYNNSKSQFKKLLFGYDELTNNTTTVLLVEGIFDKFNVDKCLELDYQEELKCLSTFGAKASKEQIYKLKRKNISNIILMFDNDVINLTKRICSHIKYDFANIMVAKPTNKDPGEMSKLELITSIDRCVDNFTYSINNVNIMKLK